VVTQSRLSLSTCFNRKTAGSPIARSLMRASGARPSFVDAPRGIASVSLPSPEANDVYGCLLQLQTSFRCAQFPHAVPEPIKSTDRAAAVSNANPGPAEIYRRVAALCSTSTSAEAEKAPIAYGLMRQELVCAGPRRQSL
jgi:hypothetical protein